MKNMGGDLSGEGSSKVGEVRVLAFVEREEVRKKQENEGKKEGNHAQKNPSPAARPSHAKLLGELFFGAGSTVVPFGIGHPCQIAG